MSIVEVSLKFAHGPELSSGSNDACLCGILCLEVLKFAISMCVLSSRVYNSYQSLCEVNAMECQHRPCPNYALLLSTNEIDGSTSASLDAFSFNL